MTEEELKAQLWNAREVSTGHWRSVWLPVWDRLECVAITYYRGCPHVEADKLKEAAIAFAEADKSWRPLLQAFYAADAEYEAAREETSADCPLSRQCKNFNPNN
jgi:hypothetical protein